MFLILVVEPMFTHFGKIVNGVDMRGEVALLSRNIKVRGAPAANSKTLGGHIKAGLVLRYYSRSFRSKYLPIRR